MSGPKYPSRNVVVRGSRTSLRLEPEMFEALDEICERERLTLPVLCNRLLDQHGGNVNLSSLLRVHALSYFRKLAGPPPLMGQEMPRVQHRSRRHSSGSVKRPDQTPSLSALACASAE